MADASVDAACSPRVVNPLSAAFPWGGMGGRGRGNLPLQMVSAVWATPPHASAISPYPPNLRPMRFLALPPPTPSHPPLYGTSPPQPTAFKGLLTTPASPPHSPHTQTHCKPDFL